MSELEGSSHKIGSLHRPDASNPGWGEYTSSRPDSPVSDDEEEAGYSRSKWSNGRSYEPLSAHGTRSRVFPSGFGALETIYERLSDFRGPQSTSSSRRRYRRRKEDRSLYDTVVTYIPTRPSSIVRPLPLLLKLTPQLTFLVCFALFAFGLTFTLKYVLNPDKTALPWRQYCLEDYPTLFSLQDPSQPLGQATSSSRLSLAPLTYQHAAWPYGTHKTIPYSLAPSSSLDELDPVGVFVGVFTMDSGVQRRNLIRESYMNHWRSRPRGSEGVRVRFIMGRPRSSYAQQVAEEIETYGDIVILDMAENMNNGKTHEYFTWAAENATVDEYTYPSATGSPIFKGEKKPDYVVKADDDAFIMLGELERHLRVAPRSKAFWGYLVKNQFMGGECYALSFDLVNYVANSGPIRSMIRGKEDKLMAKWIKMHPEKESIVWVSEKCWIYDTPQAGQVYSHGYLFPSAVQQIRQEHKVGLSKSTLALRGGPAHADQYSSVLKFQYYNFKLRPLREDMSVAEKVEGMVEGSTLSMLRDQNADGSIPPTSPPSRESVEKAYADRPSRVERFLGDEKERGGTVLVHFVKKTEWWLETKATLLGSEVEL